MYVAVFGFFNDMLMKEALSLKYAVIFLGKVTVYFPTSTAEQSTVMVHQLLCCKNVYVLQL